MFFLIGNMENISLYYDKISHIISPSKVKHPQEIKFPNLQCVSRAVKFNFTQKTPNMGLQLNNLYVSKDQEIILELFHISLMKSDLFSSEKIYRGENSKFLKKIKNLLTLSRCIIFQ